MIGIYLLKKKGTIIYVGQSIDVGARLNQHKNKIDFDSYDTIGCSTFNLDYMEQLYIDKYNPSENRAKKVHTSKKTLKKKGSNIMIRVSTKDKAILQENAGLEQVSLSNYVLIAALNKAKKDKK